MNLKISEGNELEYLIEIAKANYPTNIQSSIELMNAISNYKKAIDQKNNNFLKWENFLENLKDSITPHKLREFGNLHYEASFRCQIYDKKQKEGVHLFISFLCPYYGYYYCDFTERQENHEHSIISKHGMKINYTSYFPCTENQKLIQEKIDKLIKKHYPEYSLFSPKYAKMLIHNVIIESLKYNEIELFQLIFSTDIHMLL